MATGDYDVAIANLDRLRTESDNAKARNTNLVNAVSGAFSWNASSHSGLMGWILPFPCG